MVPRIALISLAFLTASIAAKNNPLSITVTKAQDDKASVCIAGKRYLMPRLNLEGTTSSLSADDVAAAIDINKLPTGIALKLKEAYKPSGNYLIATQAGHVEANVRSEEGSATGTPGRLMWPKTYIGTMYHPAPNLQMPGSARRTVFIQDTK
jgi:hypothetical protein